MPREHKKLVEKLDSFTNSLGDIVDILKEQVNRDKEAAFDNLSKALKDNIIQIAEDVKVVKEDIKSIKSDISSIKKTADELKAQKEEKGIFSQVGKKGAKSIVTGVGVIMLIAGAVLAIGMAFKIVGKVDFASVIALSMSIVAIAHAIEKIINIKNLSYKTAMLASTTMVIIAGGIMASSWLLRFIKPMSIPQLLTAVLIAGALGISLFLIVKAIGKSELTPGKIGTMMLLPVILPVIATGILISSLILEKMPSINPGKLFGAIIMAVVVGAMMFSIKPILSMKIESKDVAKLLLLPLIIPAIAISIVIASLAFKLYEPIPYDKLVNLLIAGVSMGAAIAAFAISIRILGKMDIESLLVGSLGVLMLAPIILFSSHVLSKGDYGNYPSIKWASGVGLSLLAFGIPTFAFGLLVLSSGGIALAAIGAGVLATGLLAAAIAPLSHVLSKGNYGIYPSAKWASGVGLSMLLFGTGAIALGALMITGIGAIAILAGIKVLSKLSQTIVDISGILNKGTYGNFPSPEWASGVGNSIYLFAKAFAVSQGLNMLSSIFGKGQTLTEFIPQIVDAIILANTKFKEAGDQKWSGYPSEDWVIGVGGSIGAFSRALEAMAGVKMKKPEEFTEFITSTVLGIITANTLLSNVKGEWKGYPSKDWVEGVGNAISVFADNIGAAMQGDKLKPKKFRDFIEMSSKAMVKSNEIFKNVEWSNYPDKNWIDGISYSMKSFNEIDNDNLSKFFDNMERFKKLDKVSDSIHKLGRSLISLGSGLRIFSRAASKNIDHLVESAASLAVLGSIDSERISNTLDILESKASSLRRISYESSSIVGFLEKIMDKSNDVVNKKENESIQTVSSSTESNKSEMAELVKYVSNIDFNLKEILRLKVEGLTDERRRSNF